MASPPRQGTPEPTWNPRWIVLGFLTVAFAWGPIIAMSFTTPPTPLLTALFAGGLLLFGWAVLRVLIPATDPAGAPGTAWRRSLILVAVCLLLWAPAFVWAEPGRLPWPWLAGFAGGAVALAGWRSGLLALAVLGAAAALGGTLFTGSPLPALLLALGCAAALWAMCQALVWIHRLWRAAHDGRQAQADLAVAEERLRVGRELHDVLGRRLAVIALRAELASTLAATDPRRAAAESDGIRVLANGTLREARRAILGDTVTDLAAQLRSAELVLRSAGVAADIAVHPVAAELPDSHRGLLASVIREATTNVLRHSDARRVSIAIRDAGPLVALDVENDGVRSSALAQGGGTGLAAGGGTGLAVLAERCVTTGAVLTSHRDDERFRLRVELPHGAGATA